MKPGECGVAGIIISPTGGRASRQIEHRIRMLVAIGSWREGERVPSSRAVAKALGVAENTVREAYVRLQEADVLDPAGQRGTKVAAAARSSALLLSVVDDSLEEAVALVHSLGIPRELLEERLRAIVASRYERGEG